MNLQPLHSKVKIDLIPLETTLESGIILAHSGKQKPESAKVLAIGTGHVLKSGVVVPLTVKVGNTVLINKHCVETVQVNGEKHYFIQESDILAITQEA